MKLKLLYTKKSLTFFLIVIGGSLLYLVLVRRGFLIPLTDIPEVLCLNGCPSPQKIHNPTPENGLLNYNQPLNKLITPTIDQDKTSILIEKSKHKLTLYYNQKPIKSYPVVFGSNPKGDKLREGDNKTPEGILRIKDLYPHPQWSKFIWLDYPNPPSWRNHFQAKMQGKLPWYHSIGGQVGIHGVPPGTNGMIDNRTNWTWGCPSLKNQDVNEIYQVVKIGTLVEILP
ncbi:MAG: L,D-transpeptidase [Calothrix sp. MO_192.B10]|nr:L,D-transpeptidase [Calothrix sp. MO_192.B10]